MATGIDSSKLLDLFKSFALPSVSDFSSKINTLTDTLSSVTTGDKSWIDTIKSWWNSLLSAVGLGEAKTETPAPSTTDQKPAPKTDAPATQPEVVTPDVPNNKAKTTDKTKGAAK